MCLIVLLEDPDTIDPAKGYEEASRGASNGEPCFCTTFWERLGIHPGIWWWLFGLLCIFQPDVRIIVQLLVSVLFQGFYRGFGIMASVSKGFSHCGKEESRVR